MSQMAGLERSGPFSFVCQIFQQSSRALEKGEGTALTCGSRAQTAAASEHTVHHIKKPKLENSKEKCCIKYSLIRASEISI